MKSRSKREKANNAKAKARRATMSRKKGGMYRTVAKKIFTEVLKGKNPVESAEKAYQVGKAMSDGLAVQTTRAPTRSRRSVRTFLENQNAFSPKIEHDSFKHAFTEPEHSYITPNKHTVKKDHPKIPKSSRHRRIAPPQSYAPTLLNEVPNVNRALFHTP